MENASKALIIAGAILISIILIGIGVMVINSSNALVDTAGEQMDQQAIQSFNSQFLNYAGSQRGSTVKSLLQTVIASNSSSKNKIEVEFKGATKEAVQVLGEISSTTRYSVSFETREDSLVNKLIIKEAGSTGGTTSDT